MSSKKIISMVLVLLVMIAPLSYGASFNDLGAYKWAEPSIQNMALNGFVGGFKDGSFKPEATLSRAELVSIINKMNGFTDEASISFKDVTEKHWAYKEINRAVQAGYVSGFSDGTFRPNDPVTREQIATILNNLYHLENAAVSNPIKDLNKVSSWAVQSVVNVVANGIMGGYPDGTFGSKGKITRAEGAVALNKIVINDIPTIEKWTVAQEIKVPTPPTGDGGNPTGGSTPGDTGSLTENETIQKLKVVLTRMDSRVIPDLTTTLQRETAGIIVTSITQYVSNPSYDTSADVASAKANVKLMNNIEYQAFKNAITSNIILGDLVALNGVFKLIEY